MLIDGNRLSHLIWGVLGEVLINGNGVPYLMGGEVFINGNGGVLINGNEGGVR